MQQDTVDPLNDIIIINLILCYDYYEVLDAIVQAAVSDLISWLTAASLR